MKERLAALSFHVTDLEEDLDIMAAVTICSDFGAQKNKL